MSDDYLRDWANAASAEFGYPQPSEAFLNGVRTRLPAGLRELIREGVNEGQIVTKGHTFTLNGIAESKGPYVWFYRNAATQVPNPCWEYFVQVGELVRLRRVTRGSGLEVTFEDGLMDLAVRRGSFLLACIEVKEQRKQVEHLVTQVRQHEKHVDHTSNDRGNDPLRKAKYILKHRPMYFVGVAIGVRYEFRVEFPGDKEFRLIPDVVPYV